LHDSGYLREEPSAGKPHARICEGEAEWLSYSTATSALAGTGCYDLSGTLLLQRRASKSSLDMACFASGRRGREVRRVDGNPHYPSYDPTTPGTTPSEPALSPGRSGRVSSLVPSVRPFAACEPGGRTGSPDATGERDHPWPPAAAPGARRADHLGEAVDVDHVGVGSRRGGARPGKLYPCSQPRIARHGGRAGGVPCIGSRSS